VSGSNVIEGGPVFSWSRTGPLDLTGRVVRLGWQLMRRYQKVIWHHDLPDERWCYYSEIDSGFEVRKCRGLPG
jgi:hypothetical protein